MKIVDYLLGDLFGLPSGSWYLRIGIWSARRLGTLEDLHRSSLWYSVRGNELWRAKWTA